MLFDRLYASKSLVVYRIYEGSSCHHNKMGFHRRDKSTTADRPTDWNTGQTAQKPIPVLLTSRIGRTVNSARRKQFLTAVTGDAVDASTTAFKTRIID
jgi:hypothetical protein